MISFYCVFVEISLVREAAKAINIDFYAKAVKIFQDRLGLTIQKTKGNVCNF